MERKPFPKSVRAPRPELGPKIIEFQAQRADLRMIFDRFFICGHTPGSPPDRRHGRKASKYQEKQKDLWACWEHVFDNCQQYSGEPLEKTPKHVFASLLRATSEVFLFSTPSPGVVDAARAGTAQ